MAKGGKTIERVIFDRLPSEDKVRAFAAIPVFTRELCRDLPFEPRSIESALFRMHHRGVLYMERDGRQFAYATKPGAEPPLDGRGGARRVGDHSRDVPIPNISQDAPIPVTNSSPEWAEKQHIAPRVIS